MGRALIAYLGLAVITVTLPRDTHSDALIEISEKIDKTVDRTVENSEDAVKLNARKK